MTKDDEDDEFTRIEMEQRMRQEWTPNDMAYRPDGLSQAAQEPVAWLYPEGLEALQNGKCWTAYPTEHDDCNIPLCIATPPLPAQEPMVFYRCNGCDYAREGGPPTICGCMEGTGFERVEYFTAPPKREWVGLTPDEIMEIGRELGLKCRLGGNPNIDFDYANAIEAKLKSKNA